MIRFNKAIKINKYCIFIGIIIFLSLNCFYLVDGTLFPMDDVTLLIEAVFFLYVYVKTYKIKIDYKYKYFILFTILLAITSSLMAYYSYKQPLWLGLRPQRHWLGAMMMYFPIVKLVKVEKITIRDILILIDILNIIYAVIIVAQFIVGNSVTIMQVLNNQRYGSIRLYISSSFVMISYFYHLLDWLKEKKFKKRNFFFIALGIFIIFFITKTRMRMIILIIASLVAIILQKFTLKKLFLILGASIVLIGFSFTTIGQDILALIFNPETSSQDTSSIREIGRTFYFETNFSDFWKAIFGSGFVNIDWPLALQGSGITKYIYYVDNGLFGLFFYYGLIFIFWVIIFYLCLFRDSLKQKNLFCFCFLFMGLLGTYSLFPDCYGTTIAFAIILALIESGMDKTNLLNQGKNLFTIGA